VPDLRCSAAINLVDTGVSEDTVMKIGGWKTKAMFSRYNAVNTDRIRVAMSEARNTRTQNATGLIRWRYGAKVSTRPFQGRNAGSIPASATILDSRINARDQFPISRAGSAGRRNTPLIGWFYGWFYGWSYGAVVRFFLNGKPCMRLDRHLRAEIPRETGVRRLTVNAHESWCDLDFHCAKHDLKGKNVCEKHHFRERRSCSLRSKRHPFSSVPPATLGLRVANSAQNAASHSI